MAGLRYSFAQIESGETDGCRHHQRVLVGMDEVRMVLWQPYSAIRFLATGYLNTCIAVGIVSPKAAILAHIAPADMRITAQGIPADAWNIAPGNGRHIFARITQLYRGNPYLFENAIAFIVTGVDISGQALMEDVAEVARHTFVNDLGLRYARKDYGIAMPWTDRPHGHASVIVEFNSPYEFPTVWMSELHGTYSPLYW